MTSLWEQTAEISGFESLNGSIKTDVLIIGGGMAGILCAYMLHQAGVPYVLAEAQTVCSGITKNTTAKITSQHGLIYDKLINKFGVERAKQYYNANEEALKMYRRLCADIDCDFEIKDAYVYSLDDRKKLEKELRALERIGAKAEFCANPGLPFNTAGAVKFPNQAQFHPLKFLQALADRYVVFHDDCGAVSRLLLELIRAEALARGYHIITCPCAMHPEDKIDHLFIPALRLAFLTDNRWHPVQLPGVQAVRCTRFVDRENLAGYRARLRFNERAAAELLEQAADLMAQAKACHDELETYYRAAVDFDRVDAAAVQCAEMLGLG